jgi:hypothetical protein
MALPRAAYTDHIDVPTEATVALTRKAFLIQLVGGGWVLAGCGGGGYGGGSAPAPSTGAGCTATIAGNHGHTLVIPVADLNSLEAIIYNITGTADHSHSVTFSAMDLYNLKFGYTVAVTSTMSVASATTTPHDHAIGEHCA